MPDKTMKHSNDERRSSTDVTFSARGRLMQLRGKNILFSSSRQELFELNETAAEIWRDLAEGQSAAAIKRAIGGSGLSDCKAGAFVEAMLAQWEELDLVHPVLRTTTGLSSSKSQNLSIAGLQIRISYDLKLGSEAASVFRHLEVSGTDPDVSWEVASSRGRLHLFRGREWLGSCQPEELPTVLKGHLLTQVLNTEGYEIALHAAALEVGGRAILLLGRPGAGKTTLTLALARSGLTYGGDDVTLVTAQGRCISLPFAPAVKSGSWPVLEPWLERLRTEPVYRRPDGKRIRYPTPEPFERLTNCEIGWVILLDRRSGEAATLRPLEPAEALHGLLAGAFVEGGNLTEAAFEALVRGTQSADLYRLSYSELANAVDIVTKACR